jgi:aryl-alcohol dehydrogenase-like predicted oxidoreductase
MEYCLLGKSDLKISRLGFGCMSLDPKDLQSENILHLAADSGINYFDTADLYNKGQNEMMLGHAFRDKRKELILATKVGNQWRNDGSGWDWNPSKEYILSSIDQSLKRLQTDYIDLYQLHGGTIEDPIDDVIEAFELLKSNGKIRYYGISSIRPNVIREYVKRSSIISVMMQYSLLDRRPEEEMLPLLKENEIGALARGSIAKGLLISKPAEHYLNYSEEEVAMAAKEIRDLSSEERSVESIAIHYVLSNPAITSAVIGIRTLMQFKHAVASINSNTITETEKNNLSNAIPINFYSEHRQG